MNAPYLKKERMDKDTLLSAVNLESPAQRFERLQSEGYQVAKSLTPTVWAQESSTVLTEQRGEAGQNNVEVLRVRSHDSDLIHVLVRTA